MLTLLSILIAASNLPLADCCSEEGGEEMSVRVSGVRIGGEFDELSPGPLVLE